MLAGGQYMYPTISAGKKKAFHCYRNIAGTERILWRDLKIRPVKQRREKTFPSFTVRIRASVHSLNLRTNSWAVWCLPTDKKYFSPFVFAYASWHSEASGIRQPSSRDDHASSASLNFKKISRSGAETHARWRAKENSQRFLWKWQYYLTTRKRIRNYISEMGITLESWIRIKCTRYLNYLLEICWIY